MTIVRLFRGDTWTRTWILADSAGKPVNLAGATARLHVRDPAGALVMSASTADGRIVIQPAEGRLDLAMPKEATAALAPGLYGWDLEVTHGDGRRHTYEHGSLRVLVDVSHD